MRFVNRTRLIGSAILALALMLGAISWLLNHHTDAIAPAPPNSDQALSNTVAALQENLNSLQAEHAHLMGSLAAARAENARLEMEKQQAEHAAKLFKELADQSGVQGQDPTNRYPTPRHLMAGIGKQSRLLAEMEAKWGDVDEDKLPPEERKAMLQSGVLVAAEFLRLKQVADQMNDDEREAFLNPTKPETMADYVSCYLYGALALDSRQFFRVNDILQRYCQQAVDDHLFQAIPGESEEAASNRTAALNQLNEAARAEIQPLLSEQQAAILGHAGLKEMKFVTAKFHPPGFAVSLGKQ